MDPTTDPETYRREQTLRSRCLDGEEAAWEQLWRHCIRGLPTAIKLMLGPRGNDEQLVEEIIDSIWPILLASDAEKLKGFDPARGQLIVYLALLAKDRIIKARRSDGRREAREQANSKEEWYEDARLSWQLDLEEFLTTLTPQEKRFGQTHLLAIPSATSSLSPSNAAFLKHQISKKLKVFLGK